MPLLRVVLVISNLTKPAALQGRCFPATGNHGLDAVFVANDHMAFAVMDTLRAELGLAIPDDASIVGYDDVPAAAWPSYDLTTVRQHTEQMIKATVDILLSEIENQGAVPCQLKIDGPLVLRGSARVTKGR